MPKIMDTNQGQPAASTSSVLLNIPTPFEEYIKQKFIKYLTAIQLELWGGVTLATVHLEPNPEMMSAILQPNTMFDIQVSGVADVERICDGRLKKSRAYPGNLLLVPSQMPIAARWNATVQHFYCLLPSALWSLLAAEYTDRDSTKLALTPSLDFRDPLSEHILRALLQELESGNAGGRLYIESLVQTLILHTLVHDSSLTPLHRFPTSHGLTSAQMRQVQDFVAEHYAHDLGLDDLAAALQFSPSYFAHQFKRSFGMPPHQYLTQVRVEQTKRLLEQGNMTIGDIAAQVGFYDQSHLAHHFKRAYGVSPKIYLQQSGD